MIDDLITRGVTEPYRMFTSRAEFRLSLRADNADQRLTEMGREASCVGDARWSAFSQKMDHIQVARRKLEDIKLSAREIASTGTKLNADGHGRTALDALSLTDFGAAQLQPLLGEPLDIAPEIMDQIKRDALYAHYIARQSRDISAMERDENAKIPRDFSYNEIPGLSNELRMKLQQIQPETLAQAGRIDGMTPAALMLLLSWIKKAEKSLPSTGT
jgi:tRNA uridine 5-carboxymethylaminomethyl modification enzyme